jgi:hypothetical protein
MTRPVRPAPIRALLALAAATALIAGCGRPGGPEPPRLLTPAELAALAAEAEAPPPDNALSARAAALRARAAGLRAGQGTGRNRATTPCAAARRNGCSATADPARARPPPIAPARPSG